ncbi:MAG: outer membrane beta-barrel protein [Cyclobacteriaceae bacterium]
MNRVALLCMIVAFPGLSGLYAQQKGWGVEAGYSITNQRTVMKTPSSESISFGRNASRFALGAFRDFSIGKGLSLRGGARYTAMGFAKHGYIESVSINYLTLPVSLRYFASDYLSIGAGVYLSFTVGGSTLNGQAITRTYHKNDDGVFLLAEYKLPANLSVSMQYVIGHKNVILADSDPILQFSQTTTNRALHLMLIYHFSTAQ